MGEELEGGQREEGRGREEEDTGSGEMERKRHLLGVCVASAHRHVDDWRCPSACPVILDYYFRY
jgi:hypothetical protein